MPEYRSDTLLRAAGLGVLIAAGGTAHAATVTLDFDRLQDGTPIIAPAVFSSTAPVREEFASAGVHFGVPSGFAPTVGGGGVLSGNFGVAGFSAPNYLAFSFNPAAHYANGQNPQPPQLFNFDRPVRQIRLNVGGFGGTARLTGFDSEGAPIVETLLSLAATVAPLEVQAPNYDIYSATLRFEGSLAGIADDVVLDVQDEPAPTEPPTEPPVELPTEPAPVPINEPPVTHCSLDGTAGANGWFLGEVRVVLTAEDSDGTVASTLCRLDGGEWEPYSGPVPVTGEGAHTVEYRSVDNGGAQEAVHSESFKIDTSAPVVNLRLTRWYLWPCNGRKLPVKVLGSVEDAGSGMASVKFQVKDEYGEVQPPLTRFGQTIVLKAAVKPRDRDGRVYQVTATATDNAGQSRSVTEFVLVPKNLGGCRNIYARLLAEARKRH